VYLPFKWDDYLHQIKNFKYSKSGDFKDQIVKGEYYTSNSLVPRKCNIRSRRLEEFYLLKMKFLLLSLVIQSLVLVKQIDAQAAAAASGGSASSASGGGGGGSAAASAASSRRSRRF
jgi:hypothetical protein